MICLKAELTTDVVLFDFVCVIKWVYILAVELSQ